MKLKLQITTFLILLFLGCSNQNQLSNKSVEENIPKYYELIKAAESLVCKENFKAAADTYKLSFRLIKKPFGKDVFNAALAYQFSNQYLERDKCLQTLINNSNDLDFVKSEFVDKYISEMDWQKLIDKQQVAYNPSLRKEFKNIHERDQLFRPMYETHDDTINTNRKINVARILSLTNSMGFPSHIELGYTNYLRGQKHDIVFHHTAQRRSNDKSVLDLESILIKAVQEGRFDPEQAIFYMSLQNDIEKGNFEVYSIWQHKHPLLSDNLNNKIWIPNLSQEGITEANDKRSTWYANSLEEIAMKADYLTKSNLPFIFTSVSKSIGELRKGLDKETAMKQYNMMTGFMKEYKN